MWTIRVQLLSWLPVFHWAAQVFPRSLAKGRALLCGWTTPKTQSKPVVLESKAYARGGGIAWKSSKTPLAALNSRLQILHPQRSIGAHMLNFRAPIPLLGHLTLPVQQCFGIRPIVLSKRVKGPARPNPFGDSSGGLTYRTKLTQPKGTLLILCTHGWFFFLLFFTFCKLFYLLFWTLIEWCHFPFQSVLQLAPPLPFLTESKVTFRKEGKEIDELWHLKSEKKFWKENVIKK